MLKTTTQDKFTCRFRAKLTLTAFTVKRKLNLSQNNTFTYKPLTDEAVTLYCFFFLSISNYKFFSNTC